MTPSADVPKQLPPMKNYKQGMICVSGFVLGCLVLDTIIVAFGGEGFGEIAWSLVTLVARELLFGTNKFVTYYTGGTSE